MGRGVAYGLSKKDPSAASWRPPGTGCSRVSKVVGFVMRLTDSERMSLAARKPNSTAWMADETGWCVFIVKAVQLEVCACRLKQFGRRDKQQQSALADKLESCGEFFWRPEKVWPGFSRRKRWCTDNESNERGPCPMAALAQEFASLAINHLALPIIHLATGALASSQPFPSSTLLPTSSILLCMQAS